MSKRKAPAPKRGSDVHVGMAIMSFALLMFITACIGLALAVPPNRYDAMKMATVELSMKDGHGSGVIISPNFILTANHVAADAGGAPMDVMFSDGTHVLAILLWADPARDVAIMALQTATKIKPARLSTFETKAGDEVWSAGYPLDFPLSINHGSVVHDGIFNAVKGKFETTVMIDATVLEGDSGGPVFNSVGEVVGLNDFRMKDFPGMNGMVSARAILADVRAVTGIN